MQEKFRMWKDDPKGFHRVLNSVIGKQKSLALPSFNVNYSVADFQFFVDIELNIHKSIAYTTRKNIQESQLRSMFLKNTEKHEILKSMKNKTSSGIDGFCQKLEKYCAESVVDPLTIVINRSMATELFPDSLRVSKVNPIYKEGDREDFSNYRPISLLPVLGKVYERVKYARFLTYINEFISWMRTNSVSAKKQLMLYLVLFSK